MKKISLIGIFLSLLGIITEFTVIENYNNFFDTILTNRNSYNSDIKLKIFNTVHLLDFGFNLSFLSIGISIISLILFVKLYTSKK